MVETLRHTITGYDVDSSTFTLYLDGPNMGVDCIHGGLLGMVKTMLDHGILSGADLIGQNIDCTISDDGTEAMLIAWQFAKGESDAD